MKDLFKIERPSFMKESEGVKKFDLKSIVKVTAKALLVYLIIQIILSIIGQIAVIKMFPEVTIEELTSSEWMTQQEPGIIINMVIIFFEGIFMFLFYKIKNKNLDIGFTKHKIISEYLVGYIMGAIIFSACILMGAIFGVVKFNGISNSINGIIFVYFLAYLLQGMGEEIVCRGILMTEYAKKNSIWVSIIINSLVFALLHIGNNSFSIIAAINIFLIGIVFSILMIKRKNIWVAGAFHSAWNFVQGHVFGIEVSGFASTSSVLSTTIQGNELLTGGLFGTEGSILTTIVILIYIFILLKSKSKESEAQ